MSTNDDDRDALKPCPFCGSVSGPKLWASVSKDFATGESHWVYCGGCAVVSPHWGIRYAAVTSWNRRAPSAPTPPTTTNDGATP